MPYAMICDTFVNMSYAVIDDARETTAYACAATTSFPDESGLTLGYDGLEKLRQIWLADGTPDARVRWSNQG